jgi:hypothetical protein
VPRVLRWRAAAVVLVLVCALSVAVLTGLLWAGTDDHRRAAVVQATGSQAAQVDWSAVLQDLDRARSLAFAEGDPTRLDGVYAAGSPALTRDRDLLARLRSTGNTAHGVRLVPTSVEVVERGDDRTVLRVVDVMPPYRLVTIDGGVSTSRPGRPATSWSVTLVHERSAWRMYDVQRG